MLHSCVPADISGAQCASIVAIVYWYNGDRPSTPACRNIRRRELNISRHTCAWRYAHFSTCSFCLLLFKRVEQPRWNCRNILNDSFKRNWSKRRIYYFRADWKGSIFFLNCLIFVYYIVYNIFFTLLSSIIYRINDCFASNLNFFQFNPSSFKSDARLFILCSRTKVRLGTFFPKINKLMKNIMKSIATFESYFSLIVYIHSREFNWKYISTISTNILHWINFFFSSKNYNAMFVLKRNRFH